MKKNTVIIIIAITLILGLLSGVVIWSKQFLPKYKWSRFYRTDKDQPYDTKMLYTLMKKSLPKGNFVDIKSRLYDEIDVNNKNSMIFFIGFKTYYDSGTFNFFREYLNMGNSIFIAAPFVPEDLISTLWEKDSLLNVGYLQDSVVHSFFNKNPEKKYPFHFQYGKVKILSSWTYITPREKDFFYKTAQFEELAFIDSSKCNFIKLTYGKGALYYFSTPLFLTNYHLDTEPGFKFASTVFDLAGNPEKIYWDSFSRLPVSNFPDQKVNNPIEFIIKNKELRWAWYISIVGIFLLFVLGLRRKQRPIPYIKPEHNTSIEYAKAVGTLYYKNASHQDLANNLMRLFSHYIKNRYNINIKNKHSEEINLLAVQSGIKASAIVDIYDKHFKIKYNPDPDAADTIDLHRVLDNFYKNCK